MDLDTTLARHESVQQAPLRKDDNTQAEMTALIDQNERSKESRTPESTGTSNTISDAFRVVIDALEFIFMFGGRIFSFLIRVLLSH